MVEYAAFFMGRLEGSRSIYQSAHSVIADGIAPTALHMAVMPTVGQGRIRAKDGEEAALAMGRMNNEASCMLVVGVSRHEKSRPGSIVRVRLCYPESGGPRASNYAQNRHR